ncbi:MAG TPA: TadE/TadG family type IV pilus assembly protein [Acidimicrobiales bacterium]|nr:TadE/TadG family type IV pilus assembly protein [Acidimicrobiales bacterium]
MKGKRGAGTEAGATTLEAVLVFPVLLLLLMLIIQFALWYHANDLASAAAQDGVRAARVEGGTAADGASRANELLDQTGPSILQGRQVSVRRGADVARVEIRGTCIRLIPFLQLPVHAVAESSTEQFRGRLTR